MPLKGAEKIIYKPPPSFDDSIDITCIENGSSDAITNEQHLILIYIDKFN